MPKKANKEGVKSVYVEITQAQYDFIAKEAGTNYRDIRDQLRMVVQKAIQAQMLITEPPAINPPF